MQTKKNLFFLVLTLFIVLPTSIAFIANCPRSREEIKINCLFIRTIEYDNLVGNVKRCEADSSILSTSLETSVTSVYYRGKKIAAGDIKDINGLWIDQANFKFVPNGIKSAFPNLKAISMMGSGLLAINKSDLEVFGEKLEYVDFQKNAITFLDADLFGSNENLKVANFWENSIEYIEAEFFTNIKSLEKLQRLNLGSNKCINQIFKASKKEDNVATTVKFFTWSHKNCENKTVESAVITNIQTILCPKNQTKKVDA